MDTRYKKDKGDEGEAIVAQYYQNKWYVLIEKNYTIAWWEIDLILKKKDILTFVEVKVVDYIDDLYDYVTPRKLGHIKHTIQYYLLQHPSDKTYVLDVVFVKNNSIVEAYENVTNT